MKESWLGQLRFTQSGEVAITNKELAGEQCRSILRQVYNGAKLGNKTCIDILKGAGILA